MKKLLFFTFLFVSIGFPLKAQILTEDFESGLSTFQNKSGNTHLFRIDSVLYQSGNKSAYDSSVIRATDTLYHSMSFDLTTSANPILSFWHIANLDTSDKAQILISTDSGLTYNPIPDSAYKPISTHEGYNSSLYFNENSYKQWQISNFPTNNWWKKETFDLSGYTFSSKMKIIFVLNTDSAVNKSGWYLDDIEIKNAPCSNPFAISLLNVTEDTATLTWENGGADSVWQLQYDTANFSLGSGNFTSFFSSDTFGLGGLDTGVNYQVYVRSICTGGDTSSWIGPFSFRTNCGNVFDRYWGTYNQSFDNGVDLSDFCWTQARGLLTNSSVLTYGTSNWELTNYKNDRSNSISAKINLSALDSGEWLISPTLDLGTDPNVYKRLFFNLFYTSKGDTILDSLGISDTLTATISYDNGLTWDKINSFVKFSGHLGLDEFRYLIRGTTGKVKLAFYLHSSDTNSDGDLFIDNFWIESYLPIGIEEHEKKKNSVKLFPNPTSAHITIQVPEDFNLTDPVQLNLYNTSGVLIQSRSIKSKTTKMNTSDLPSGIYMFQFSNPLLGNETYKVVVY